MKYRVLRSIPGMWEFYEGYVDVFARNEENASIEAIVKRIERRYV